MKFNWGTGIVIAFGLFMAFILQYVYKVQSDPYYNYEMVTEDYYKKELNVNGERERKSMANLLKNPVQIIDTEQGVVVTFPTDFDAKNITGTVTMYRPSNEKLDFEFPLQLETNHLLIPKNKLEKGVWDISVDWQYQSNQYLNQQTLQVK
ncbi:FixH family protein [Flavobacterium agricola]|uniref:FixH family protein n=1 Tax=Flavobacterium agricola TaxID=2870839 RepID=A0ABY6M1V4_9FLAO|nr:FixH family protein [Flavobacterium agricola]UYW02416.1 FixH family protein [Flavobacterium agricola]